MNGDATNLFRRSGRGWTLTACLASLFVSAVMASDADAQGLALGPGTGYVSTPTLSPYLDLLRRDSGVLPNYQQFVRPQLRLRRELRTQAALLQRQGREIRSLNREVSRPPTTRATTGTRAGFMQYGPYYPLLDR